MPGPIAPGAAVGVEDAAGLDVEAQLLVALRLVAGGGRDEREVGLARGQPGQSADDAHRPAGELLQRDEPGERPAPFSAVKIVTHVGTGATAVRAADAACAAASATAASATLAIAAVRPRKAAECRNMPLTIVMARRVPQRAAVRASRGSPSTLAEAMLARKNTRRGIAEAFMKGTVPARTAREARRVADADPARLDHTGEDAEEHRAVALPAAAVGHEHPQRVEVARARGGVARRDRAAVDRAAHLEHSLADAEAPALPRVLLVLAAALELQQHPEPPRVEPGHAGLAREAPQRGARDERHRLRHRRAVELAANQPHRLAASCESGASHGPGTTRTSKSSPPASQRSRSPDPIALASASKPSKPIASCSASAS